MNVSGFLGFDAAASAANGLRGQVAAIVRDAEG